MEKELVTITTEFIKLDNLMKITGCVQTGGMAKNHILNGDVKVNGDICLMRGKKMRSGDTMEFENKLYEVK